MKFKLVKVHIRLGLYIIWSVADVNMVIIIKVLDLGCGVFCKVVVILNPAYVTYMSAKVDFQVVFCQLCKMAKKLFLSPYRKGQRVSITVENIDKC